MTERESKRTPNKAKLEQAKDLAWLGENGNVLSAIAEFGYADHGRGAVIVDERERAKQSKGNRQVIVLGDVPDDLIHYDGEEFGEWYYLPLESLHKPKWKKTSRKTTEYDPKKEFVAILIREDRAAIFRLKITNPATWTR